MFLLILLAEPVRPVHREPATQAGAAEEFGGDSEAGAGLDSRAGGKLLACYQLGWNYD